MEPQKADAPAPAANPAQPQQVPPAPEAVQLKDQLLRIQADFENARKRWRKEHAEVQERANADLLRELLEITDDFQRALESPVRPEQVVHPSTNAQDERRVEGSVFRMGVEMISQRLRDFLKSYGIAPIEAVGKPFDPLLHEAVAHEVNGSVPEATVLEELRRGYSMNGKVLRTAVVKVSKGKEDLGDGTSNRD